MKFYEYYLEQASRRSGAALREMQPLEAQGVRANVEVKFGLPGSGPLWERLRHRVSTCRTDAYALLGGYGSDKERILFFDKDETPRMFVFPPGDTLSRLLEECPLMEAYLTNLATDYVLCRNHHDYLTGWGSCNDWLRAIEGETEAGGA